MKGRTVDTKVDKAIDAILMWGICLPLSLGAKTRSKAVRTLCFLFFFVWALPAVLLLAVPLIVLMAASTFQDYIYENQCGR